METREQSKRVRLRTAAAVLVVAASAAYAAVQVCNAPLAEIRAGKKSLSDVVATVKKGESVEVIEKDNRGWLKVKVNGKEGYVYKSALEAPKTRGLLASSDPRASETELAAAGKGLTDQTIQYATTKNLSTAGIEKMLETRRAIDERQVNAFMAEGKLNVTASATEPHAVEPVAVADRSFNQGK